MKHHAMLRQDSVHAGKMSLDDAATVVYEITITSTVGLVVPLVTVIQCTQAVFSVMITVVFVAVNLVSMVENVQDVLTSSII